MKTQLFNFNNAAQVRTMRDENGEFWFAAKDSCNALGYTKYRDAIAQHVEPEERVSISVDTLGGKQKMTFVNESGLYALIFGSGKPEAKVFRKWVTSQVLPALRKTGNYSLQNLLLPAPSQWTKTFPDEFMRQVLKLYGYEFDRKKGTPSFVGHFINKYVYNTLDRQMAKALKEARARYATDNNLAPERVDEVAFLHQFLGSDGKEALREQLISVQTLAANAPTIESFDASFGRVFAHRNQLQMRLN